MKLAKYISELLYENDKLVIPGLGTFICENQSARIDTDDIISISPPKKTIRFDADEKVTDIILARHISKSENITLIAAKKIINDFVIEVTREMKEGKRVILTDIGVFSTDHKGNFTFKEEGKINYQLESFGMDDVKPSFVKEAEKKVKETKEEPVIKPDKQPSEKVTLSQTGQEEEKIERKKIPVFAWILIILFPVAVFIITLWIVNPVYFNEQGRYLVEKVVQLKEDIFNQGKLQDDQAALAADTVKTTEIPKDTAIALMEEANMYDSSIPETPIVVSPEKTVPVPEKKTATTTIQTQTTPSVSKKFYLIAGSFREKSNAEILVMKLQKKGYKSEIVGQSAKGFYMVCFNAWDTKNEATKELYRIKQEENSDSWIYEKK